MNELKIITNSVVPAKVDFNRQEISDMLDVTLAKYEGLVFNEEGAKECRQTLTELRKGQKAVDQFRLKTKKILTESVTEFENDCKVLSAKFTEVIDPLKEQADFFEENRREEKRIEVQEIIENVVEEYELTDKYSSQLELKEGYLIASISIKKVTEELEHQAKKLKEQQDEEELDRGFIIDLVNESNESNELNLLTESYTRMMEHVDTRTIVTRIKEDSKKLIKQREDERLRIAKLEEERIAKENELEAIRIAKEQENKRFEELAEIEVSNVFEEVEESGINLVEFDKLPTTPQLIIKNYIVKGNEEQIKDLEIFLNAREIDWEIK